MTGRLLPVAAAVAAGIALIGLAVHALTPQHGTGSARATVRHTQAPSSLDVPPAQLIGTATDHAQRLARCPAPGRPVTTSLPARTTCGRLTVLRAQPAPDIDGSVTVLLIGVLHLDPVLGNRSGPQAVPLAMRVLVRRNPAGALTAQVIGP